MSSNNGPSRRQSQVNELLKRELSLLIESRLEWPPNVLVTVTEVAVAKDLQHASVWVSILPDASAPALLLELQRRASKLHTWLYGLVRFRPIPALNFRLDTTGARGAEVEALLDRLNQNPDLT